MREAHARMRRPRPNRPPAGRAGIALSFRSFDKTLQQMAGGGANGDRADAPENLSFRSHGAFDVQLRDDLFLTAENFDAGVLQKAQAAARLSRGMPVGMAEFRDVHVHVASGIIIDTVNQCCWHGSLLNWTSSALRRNVVREFGGGPEDKFLHVDGGALDDCPRMESAILVAAAGYSIYGHWLLDYLPRINRITDAEFERHPALRQPQKSWAGSLASLFAPNCRFTSKDADQPFLKVERLLVPTTARAHGALEEGSMRGAWTRLDRILADGATSGGSGRRLFISRQKLDIGRQSTRLIRNIANLESKAVAAGFEAVYPETLTFAEQRKIFSEADVVLGEDGSGLHNVIFCRPGARLGVIATDRKNTLHAMIANTCGLHVTYISASAVDDGDGEPAIYRASPRDFDHMLGVLLARH